MQRICAKYACFPGNDLVHVMNELAGLHHLPERAAMVGTFIRIEKPYNWGYTYYCYEKHMAIILSYVLMRVAGSRMLVLAGQVGDAHF